MKISLVFLLLLFVQPTSAQDWTQWRGPARDGSVTAKNTPTAWPEGLRQTWRVDVGEGFSSPVISGQRAFVHARRDPEEIVVALDLKDGKVLWQQKYQATFQKNQYAVNMAKGPNATPLVAGDRLFTLGVTGVLAAWDTATAGRYGSVTSLIWLTRRSCSVVPPHRQFLSMVS
jgi:outer membrane protein assembly factor BamB